MEKEKPSLMGEQEEKEENQATLYDDVHYDVANRFIRWVCDLIDSNRINISLVRSVSSYYITFSICGFGDRLFSPSVSFGRGRVKHFIELRDDILFVDKNYYSVTYDPNCNDPDKIYCPINFGARS